MGQSTPLSLYVDSDPDFQIVGDRVYWTAVILDKRYSYSQPIKVFRRWIEEGTRILEIWDEDRPAIPMHPR